MEELELPSVKNSEQNTLPKSDPSSDSNSTTNESVSFTGLFVAADTLDYVLMFFGSIGACIHGAALPVFFVLFGRMINSLGHLSSDPHRLSSEVSKVSDNLLHDASSNQETLIFCSQTLRSKVQRDFEELPSEAFLPLRDSLNEVFNYKIAARPDRRRQFEKELTSAIEIALNILSACLNIIELKEQVLEAFASWLRLRHRIPASTLASHPLVLTALSSLNSDILSEASVNGI